MLFHHTVLIEIRNPSAGGGGFALTDGSLAMDHLPLKVAEIHAVIVHDAESPDPGRGQIKEQR